MPTIEVKSKKPYCELKKLKKDMLITFQGELVFKSYRLDEILTAKAQGKRICDFVYDIDSGKSEQAILKTWTDWFTFKKVPWAVTKGRVYKLWKIWEGLTDEEMRRINNAVSGKKGG